MSGETAGQQAYEGFVAFQGDGDVQFETWAEKDENGDRDVMGRADWEAAGRAVETEQLRLVRLELLQARGEATETAAELSRIKARHAAVLGKFTSNGSGYTARMSGVVLARCYADANLPVRDDLSHLAGQ